MPAEKLSNVFRTGSERVPTLGLDEPIRCFGVSGACRAGVSKEPGYHLAKVGCFVQNAKHLIMPPSANYKELIVMTKLFIIAIAASFGVIMGNGCEARSKKPAGPPNVANEQPEKLVLGQQLADAAAAEEKRKARGDLGKSPMPEEKYDKNSDELDLLRPRLIPLDAALAELARRFAGADAATRMKMRDSISMDEFYILWNFARRAAVFAIRERSVGRIVDGLTAVAMIEIDRIDWRDATTPLDLLRYAATRIGADYEQLFKDAASLAEPRMAKIFDTRRELNLKDNGPRSCGYEEVTIDGVMGLIGWRWKEYQPRCDLAKAAIEIADLIAKDNYRPDSIDIATQFFSNWLETGDNSALVKSTKSVRAAASFHAYSRPKDNVESGEQMLMVFFVETADPTAASTLLSLSKQKKPKDYAMFGVAEKTLFCLVVGRASMHGVDSIETREKLSRFSEGLTRILQRHTQ
jgi:hypothetical protein